MCQWLKYLRLVYKYCNFMEKINNSVNLNLFCDQNLQIMLLGNILIFLLINYNNKDLKFGKIIVIYKINFFWEQGDLKIEFNDKGVFG